MNEKPGSRPGFFCSTSCRRLDGLHVAPGAEDMLGAPLRAGPAHVVKLGLFQFHRYGHGAASADAADPSSTMERSCRRNTAFPCACAFRPSSASKILST